MSALFCQNALVDEPGFQKLSLVAMSCCGIFRKIVFFAAGEEGNKTGGIVFGEEIRQRGPLTGGVKQRLPAMQFRTDGRKPHRQEE